MKTFCSVVLWHLSTAVSAAMIPVAVFGFFVCHDLSVFLLDISRRLCNVLLKSIWRELSFSFLFSDSFFV